MLLILVLVVTTDVPVSALVAANAKLEWTKSHRFYADMVGNDPSITALGEPIDHMSLSHNRLNDYLVAGFKPKEDLLTYGYTFPILRGGELVGIVEVDPFEGQWVASVRKIGDRSVSDVDWANTMIVLEQVGATSEFRRIRLRTCIFEVPILEDCEGDWLIVMPSGVVEPADSAYVSWTERIRLHLD